MCLLLLILLHVCFGFFSPCCCCLRMTPERKSLRCVCVWNCRWQFFFSFRFLCVMFNVSESIIVCRYLWHVDRNTRLQRTTMEMILNLSSKEKKKKKRKAKNQQSFQQDSISHWIGLDFCYCFFAFQVFSLRFTWISTINESFHRLLLYMVHIAVGTHLSIHRCIA